MQKIAKTSKHSVPIKILNSQKKIKNYVHIILINKTDHFLFIFKSDFRYEWL